MDKKRALLNISTSLIFKVILLIITLLSRRYLVNYLGNEANGLYSLFVSILGFLAVAELGVGSAITFSLYKPIVENDENKISALYYLYRRVYLIIAGIISVAGVIILPFLPTLAKGNTGEFNIYLNYLLFLASTLLTYFYAYKTSFINAHKDNYITTIIRSTGQILEATVQIITLIYFQSFELFFLSIVLSNILQWVTTNYIFNKKYKKTINDYKIIDDELKAEVIDKTKAMFMHKIGGLLVNTLNGVVISAFVGVIILGKYTNYMTIITGVSSFLSLAFVALTSIFGHSFAKNSKEVVYNQYLKMYTFNFVIGVLFYMGFLAIADDLITIIFSGDQIISRDIIVVLTINYFIQFLRQSTLTFKDASGTFYHDRYKPIFEGVLNLILSLILVNVMGVSGVLIATIITNILICHTVEPYVLYKHGFEMNPKKHYFINYILISTFVGAVFIYEAISMPVITNVYVQLIVNGFISVAASIIILLFVYILIKPIRKQINDLIVIGIKFIFKRGNKK